MEKVSYVVTCSRQVTESLSELECQRDSSRIHNEFDRRDFLPNILFRYTQKPKTLQDSPSHRILWHMHGALNIDKNKN